VTVPEIFILCRRASERSALSIDRLVARLNVRAGSNCGIRHAPLSDNYMRIIMCMVALSRRIAPRSKKDARWFDMGLTETIRSGARSANLWVAICNRIALHRLRTERTCSWLGIKNTAQLAPLTNAYVLAASARPYRPDSVDHEWEWHGRLSWWGDNRRRSGRQQNYPERQQTSVPQPFPVVDWVRRETDRKNALAVVWVVVRPDVLGKTNQQSGNVKCRLIFLQLLVIGFAVLFDGKTK